MPLAPKPHPSLQARRQVCTAPLTGALASALLAAVGAASAIAGDADYEITDDHDFGAAYFGEAKDIKGLTPMSRVLVKAVYPVDTRFHVASTDADGRFRINGFGADIDPDRVEVTCAKDGYRLVDVIRRRLSSDKSAPVEIECLLEKK